MSKSPFVSLPTNGSGEAKKTAAIARHATRVVDDPVSGLPIETVLVLIDRRQVCVAGWLTPSGGQDMQPNSLVFDVVAVDLFASPRC